MQWTMVQKEADTAAMLREKENFLTSPRDEELSERARHQVKLASSAIRGLIKAGAVGEGKVRVNASGYAHIDPDKKPTGTDGSDFVAISIGKVD